MAAPPHPLAIPAPSAEEAEPDRTSGPRPKRPSRLGLTLAGCLLAGLFVWRQAVPEASPWLDLAALTAAWVFLLTVRTLRQ